MDQEPVQAPYSVNLNQILGREINADALPPHIQEKLSQLNTMLERVHGLFEKAKACDSVASAGLTYDYLHLFKEFHVVLRELDIELMYHDANLRLSPDAFTEPALIKKWAKSIYMSHRIVQRTVSQLRHVAKSIEAFDDELPHMDASSSGPTADNQRSGGADRQLRRKKIHRNRASVDIKLWSKLILTATKPLSIIYHEMKQFCPPMDETALAGLAFENLQISDNKESEMQVDNRSNS
ncbi:hypothetical protein F4776DRAFT_640069 [Hypoxylon sp. NC0597]|nr:hypothetical protein F4776DRAFT_640069 [Hypoxylon sp. NC0597]